MRAELLPFVGKEKNKKMFEVYRKELEWGGRPLVMETGKIARQSDGAIMVTYGDTVVLATAVAQKAPKPGVDFFPLTVNYQEKTYKNMGPTQNP